MARSCTLPLIRTSCLINVMLMLLYPIYSIPYNLSIHPGITKTPQFYYQHNPSYIVIQPGTANAVLWTASIYSSMYLAHVRDLPAPDHVVISFMILFFDPNAQRTTHALSAYPYHLPLQHITDSLHIDTKHIVNQNISLTNTYKHQTSCQSEYLTCYQNI